MKELEKAKIHYSESLDILRDVFGHEDHPTIAANFGNLGLVFKEMRDPNLAKESLTKCLVMMEKLGLKEHPDYEFFKE